MAVNQESVVPEKESVMLEKKSIMLLPPKKVDVSKYITFSLGDPQLKNYLQGTFSTTQRAIPIPSLNGYLSHITFRVVDIASISRPSWFVILFKSLRWGWLPLTCIPILFVYLGFRKGEVHGLSMALSLWSLLCFYLAVFLFNDSSDYITGTDGVGRYRINPVLKKGWMSAKQIHQYAKVWLLLGMGAGLPILWFRPFTLVIVSLFSIIGLVGYSLKGRGFKALGVGELVIYLCLGPFSVIGFAFATTGSFHFQHLLFGFFWGGVAATALSFKHFQHLMLDEQAGVRTLMRRLGFDRGKWWLSFQIFANALFCLILHFYFFIEKGIIKFDSLGSLGSLDLLRSLESFLPGRNSLEILGGSMTLGAEQALGLGWSILWVWTVLAVVLGWSFYLVKRILAIDSSLSSALGKLHRASILTTFLYGALVICMVLW